MDRRRFERLVERALRRLPARFRDSLQNVAVVVEDWPRPEHLDDVGAEDKRDLLGLYLGVPLTERFDYNMALPDRILIFQKPIEAACATDDDVVEQVRITVLHEIAHHFGMDDAELERLGLD